MIQIIDANEGSFGSGQYPEAQFLVATRAGLNGNDVIRFGKHSNALAGLCAANQRIRPRFGLGSPLARPEVAPSAISIWGRSAVRWALRQAPGTGLSVHLLDGPRLDTASARRLTRKIALFHSIHLYDSIDAESWKHLGAPGARMKLHDVGLEPSQRNPELRQRLRCELEVEDDEKLVMPLCAPWNALDAHHLTFLIGILRVHGWKTTALIPADSWRLEGARQFCKRGGIGSRIIVIDGPMTPWAPACDAAFLDEMRPRDRLCPFTPRGALRILMREIAMAGVPIAMAPGNALARQPHASTSLTDKLRPILDIFSRQSPKPRNSVEKSA